MIRARTWLLVGLLAMTAVALAAGYATYLQDLAFRESANRPWVVNQYGYMGLYQMGRTALIDAGYMDSSGRWTGKNGATSQQAFLASAEIQTTAINDYNRVQWGYITRMGLDRYVGQTVGGVQITESGLLAGAHLLGAGNLATFLRSDGATVPRDGNRVPITQYIAAFGGHGLSFDGPLPAIDLATRTGPNTYIASGYTPTYGDGLGTQPATGTGTGTGTGTAGVPGYGGGAWSGVPADDPETAFAAGSGVTGFELSLMIAPLGTALTLLLGAWLVQGSFTAFHAGSLTAGQLGFQTMRVVVCVSVLNWLFYT